MSISVLASIPEIQSAIKIGGDGMRIQFDIPESEMTSAIQLHGMRKEVLQLIVAKEKETVEPEPCPPKPKKSKGEMSKSQQLREALWEEYKVATNSSGVKVYGGFQAYYENRMDQFIQSTTPNQAPPML